VGSSPPLQGQLAGFFLCPSFWVFHLVSFSPAPPAGCAQHFWDRFRPFSALLAILFPETDVSAFAFLRAGFFLPSYLNLWAPINLLPPSLFFVIPRFGAAPSLRAFQAVRLSGTPVFSPSPPRHTPPSIWSCKLHYQCVSSCLRPVRIPSIWAAAAFCVFWLTIFRFRLFRSFLMIPASPPIGRQHLPSPNFFLFEKSSILLA